MPAGPPARRAAEWALRLLALGLLALALVQAVRRPAAAAAAQSLGSAELAAGLRAWAAAGAPDSVRLALDAVPAPDERLWLRALARAGAHVSWRGNSLPPVALALVPVPHPRGGTRISVAAPAGTALPLGDAAGPLDTIRSAAAGASLTTRGTLAEAAVTVRGVARARLADSAAVRRILVLGPAGWEAKFVVAALEEDGWIVDARLAVAPRVGVTQGAGAPPDTARHSAVVVVDSLGDGSASAITRFVRSGGGLVLAGRAARAPGLAALAPGGVGAALSGPPGPLPPAAPLRGLTLHPVAAAAPDALVLARDERGPAVVARRVGRGRVVQAGYADTWRWRMEGPDDAPAAHRAWWSGVVGAVAYTASGQRAACSVPPCLAEAIADPAPYAALVATLGPPVDVPVEARTLHAARSTLPLRWPLFLLILAPLLAEWGLRRARGAR